MSEEATLDEFAQAELSKERKETPIGELPADWDVEWLNNVVAINSDGFSEDDWPSDTFEYISLSKASNGEILGSKTTRIDEAPSRAQRTVQQGDVLVGTVRPKQKSHGLVAKEHDGKICSSGFGVLRTGPNLNSRYLIQEVLSNRFFSQMEAYVAGSGYPAVKLSDLKKHRVSIPPLSEQRKIATVLYTVDQAIEKTEEITEQTHVIRKSLMQDVFHGRHKDFKEYQTTPVGEIPTHWSVASIGDVVHNAQYGISESLSEEGQYPVFRMNNIENGYMIDEPLKYIDLDDDEFEKYRVKNGDILFNRTNSLELVGKTGIYELEGDHVFASYLVRLQTNEEADPHYLNYYMNSAEAQNRMMDFATKGVSQANINATSIQQVKLPLPSIEEQKEIANRLNSIDSQIEANKRYKFQLSRLKQGLMQDLLSGTVRTTDTNITVPDEVAQHG